MNPSDLPWWGWLLCAAVTGLIALVAYVVSEEHDSCLAGTMSVVFGLATAFLVVIGIVRLVKWIWNG